MEVSRQCVGLEMSRDTIFTVCGLILVLRVIVLVLVLTVTSLVLILPLLSWSCVSRPRQFKISDISDDSLPFEILNT